MTTYLTVWGILPGFLFLLAVWSWVKLRILKGAREQTGLIAKQFLFCLIAYLLSALILSSGVISTINEGLLSGFVDDSFLEWLIFPIVLVLLAMLGQKRSK